MLSIAPTITQIATSGAANVFLVDGDDGVIAVDAGTTATVGAVLEAAADITCIVLTHAHPDHVQAVPELREHTGARVLVHAADAAWLSHGHVPGAGRSGVSARAYDRLPRARWAPFQPDGTVEDGDLIDGLRVVHTPGHSPGHIVLLHEPTRTLLAGDAIFHTGRIGLGPSAFAADPAARSAGVGRIPLDVTAVGFGHGDPLSGPALDTFHAFLARHRR